MRRLSIEDAVELLRAGNVVALPTETVYGLAGRADSDDSVRAIFAAKGRQPENPLICHVCSVAMLERYAFVEEDDRPLFTLWPGPFTLLLRKRGIPDSVTAGSPLCAFRIPAHPIFLQAIEQTGLPLAAPSANLSGQTSPVTAAMVEQSLENRIPGVVDGGPCSVGIESTVVLRTGRTLHILRPGAIGAAELGALGYTVVYDEQHTKAEAIEKAVGAGAVNAKVVGHEAAAAEEVGQVTAPDEQRGLLSPGRLPVHYAPAVPVILVEARYTEALHKRLLRYLNGETADFHIEEARLDLSSLRGKRAALLTPDNDASVFAARLYRSLSELSETAPLIVAYTVVRADAADANDVDTASEVGIDIGDAVNDRLRRAASARLRPLQP